MRLYQTARRVVRKATKPLRLWLNAWQYKRSEENVEYFESFREHLIEQQRRERFRQVKLQQQRNQIAGW